MKKGKLFCMGVFLLSVMVILSACNGSAGQSKQSTAAAGDTTNDTIKFVLAGPQTGDAANQGIQQKEGAQLAVDEINAAGGVKGKKLVMEVMDDQANPNQATLVAQKVINDADILAVDGHDQSGCSLSALPIYQKVNMPVISPLNTNPTICEQGFKNYFRIISSDSVNTKNQVYMAVKELGCKKPGLIWENSDYGSGMRDVAIKTLKDEFGITPAGDESYVANVDRDYSAQITKFKANGVDAILVLGEYTATALVVKQNIASGLNAKIVAATGSSNPQFIRIAGADAEGAYVMTCYDPNDPRSKQADFTKKFEETFHDQPGEWAAHSYDVVYLIKAAYEAGGTTRDTLITALHNLKGFEGVTGLIEFNDKGDVPNKKVSVMRVEGGKFVTYVPENF
ncbi:ABC transporter substrate-binding protein [Caproiciproducens sp.]